MAILIKQGETTNSNKSVPFSCVDASDGYTPETGLTFAAADIKIKKPGVAEANSAGTVTEVGRGIYEYYPTAAELNTPGILHVAVDKSGVRPSVTIAQIVPWDPYNPASLGLSNLANPVLTGSQVATAVLTDANGVDTGYTLQAVMRLMASVLLGRLSGAGTGTEVFRDINNTKNRVTAVIDANKNRTSITLDPS